MALSFVMELYLNDLMVQVKSVSHDRFLFDIVTLFKLPYSTGYICVTHVVFTTCTLAMIIKCNTFLLL